VNNLVDRAIIAELYAAGQEGARIDLVVRSCCCLRPGVPGMSEGISVRSIVGGYLEHSRIFRFGRGTPDASYFIGSADLMPRNLDGRVEALAPIEDRRLQRHLDVILDTGLDDDVLAWELRPGGTWHKVETTRGLDVQAALAGRSGSATGALRVLPEPGEGPSRNRPVRAMLPDA
jgi:polyphosphate kinase